MNIKVLNKNIQPIILFTTKAYSELRSMYTTTESKTYEFMYIGEVEHINNVYAIKHVRLIPQCQISMTHCETDDDKYPIWLQEQYNVKDRKLIRFHGHSHVNMGTTPSGDDDNAIMKMMNYVSDFFIQFIMNQKEDYTLNLYDKQNNLIYENLNFKLITEQGHILSLDGEIAINPSSEIKLVLNKDNNKLLLREGIYLNLTTFETTIEDNYIEMSINKKPKLKIEQMEKFKKVVEKDIKKLNIKFPTTTYKYDYNYNGYYNGYYNSPYYKKDYKKTTKDEFNPCLNCKYEKTDFCKKECTCADCVSTLKNIDESDCKNCTFNKEKLHTEYMKKLKKGKKK